MKHLIVFLLALTVYSCEKTTQETVVGVYTRNARKNDLTTLELQSNNRFVFKDKSEEGEVIEYGK